MKKLLYLFQLFFLPRRLLNSVTRDGIKDRPDKKTHILNLEGNRITQLRLSFWNTTKIIVGIAVVSGVSGFLINSHSPFTNGGILGLRVASSLTIAWAVLAKLGKEIESIGGTSMPEQLNSFLFKILYFIGVSGIITSIYLKSV